MIARCLLSLSSFVVSCLCLRMSIAGNKVPPVPNDIESMGGTNSNNRNLSPAIPRWRVLKAWCFRLPDVKLARQSKIVPIGMCYIWKGNDKFWRKSY
jgi:hypothetical protein